MAYVLVLYPKGSTNSAKAAYAAFVVPIHTETRKDAVQAAKAHIPTADALEFEAELLEVSGTRKLQ